MKIMYLIISTVMIAVGLAGIFIPVLPGVGLVFGATLLYAWSTGFQVITPAYLVLFAALAAIASLVDYLSGLITAQKYGASKYGIVGSILGGISGLVVFGILGLIIGQIIGIILGEIYYGKAMKESLKLGIIEFIGYLLGSTVKVVLAGLIAIIFYFKVF